jgi:hypothetical protein
MGTSVLVAKDSADPMKGVSAQRCRVVPSFPENCLGVADRWALDCQLNVVPWGVRAVNRSYLQRLWVTRVVAVISSAMTEINSSDEGDVAFGMFGMS